MRFGMNVIELGRSLGIISHLIRARIGDEVQQNIVETVPELADICRKQTQNHLTGERISVISAAIAYGIEKIAFIVGGYPRLGQIAHEVRDGMIEVLAITLAQLSEGLYRDASAALVCDIEGSEMGVLQNEDEFLRRFAIINAEIHPLLFEEIGNSEMEFFSQCRVGLDGG